MFGFYFVVVVELSEVEELPLPQQWFKEILPISIWNALNITIEIDFWK